MSNLVIVESPSKANTIKGYLGSGYKVIASKGHVRDLPKSSLGVDIDNNFEARYINIRGKGDLIKELKKEAKKATKVFLATDPDREGEAISWHLANALGLDSQKAKRITFNEVTKSAIKAAIKVPRDIDMDLVNSQQARRILDRIVGYKISPILWKSIKSGLSAGRVQSVATRIIVEREEEIKAFNPEEYWTIDALLESEVKKSFKSKFYGEDGKKIDLHTEADANDVLKAIEGKEFIVTSVKKAVRTKNPLPPFITSTMQQEASRKLGFQLQRIMKVAQELYEGINIGSKNGGVQGLITYMRTDSLRISADAQAAAKDYIVNNYGDSYYPSTPRVYKSKGNAQDAHEAIRPSKITLTPDSIKKYLTPDQFKLYRLIWSRFVASQMEAATFDTVNAVITANDKEFHASGSTVKFAGYLTIYQENDSDKDSNSLPELNEGQVLKALDIKTEQHFTEPPARYTEASLIKFLEEMGIGRPSTYSPIITTIIQRNYVKRQSKALMPTPLGEVTTKLMKESFPDIVDYKFTATLEDRLDSIESGENTLLGVLSDFYGPFAEELSRAEKEMERIEVPAEETDIVCELCGAKMIIKNGRFGKFAACPNYPECKNTKALGRDGKVVEAKEKEEAKKAGFKCELCGAEMVIRTGRYGNFYACENYPKCKNTKRITKDTGVACPKCGAKVVAKSGRKNSYFYACERYPDCDFSSWDLPTGEFCPNCGKPLFRKKGKNLIVCNDKACGYKKEESNEQN
ncbi:MAG: type I DNA topoisomerase [Clostridia bacterium]|nr:type I DNA topoisomerase [Clostridia bacterium]